MAADVWLPKLTLRFTCDAVEKPRTQIEQNICKSVGKRPQVALLSLVSICFYTRMPARYRKPQRLAAEVGPPCLALLHPAAIPTGWSAAACVVVVQIRPHSSRFFLSL